MDLRKRHAVLSRGPALPAGPAARLVQRSGHARGAGDARLAFPAWLVRVVTADGTADLTVTGFSGGRERTRRLCDFPGQTVEWRTRGLQRVVLEGTGSASFIGYHLLDGNASWQHLTHLCLPVIDPAYRCGGPAGSSEEQIAAARMPKPVAAEWTTRFAPQFGDLSAALHRLVRHEPPATLPPSSAQDAPRLVADERQMLALALLDPHVARCSASPTTTTSAANWTAASTSTR